MPRKFNVVGVGEVLWDLLASGPQLGGAPANFAYHAHALGANAHAIIRVGNDERGREILRRFRAMGLPTDTVQDDEQAPTGTATVALGGQGGPNFVIQENVAWDFLAAAPAAESAASAADAICFGTLAQRNPVSRAAIQRLLAAAPANALRVFDINLRQHYYSRELVEASLRLSNTLKLNHGELQVLAEMFALTGPPEKQLENLSENFSQQIVALTQGGKGSLLYRDGRCSRCVPQPIKVVDTVGAGDAFTAALVMGLLHQLDLDEINAFANHVARYVCSQPGATPPLPAFLATRFGVRD